MISVPPNRRPAAGTPAGLLAAALALALLAGAAGAASAVGASGVAGASGAQATNETTLTVGDATVEPNANDTVRVSLDRVPEGLAGFEVTLTVESNATGSFTGARYPEDYQPTTDPAIGASGRTITLEAADLGNVVQPGATNVTLASVSVTGDESGTAELTATDLQVDADGGSKVQPAVEAGILSIGAAGGGAVPADESRGDGDAAPDDASGGEGGETAGGTADEFPVDTTGLGLVGFAVVAGLLGVGVFVWRD